MSFEEYQGTMISKKWKISERKYKVVVGKGVKSSVDLCTKEGTSCIACFAQNLKAFSSCAICYLRRLLVQAFDCKSVILRTRQKQ